MLSVLEGVNIWHCWCIALLTCWLTYPAAHYVLSRLGPYVRLSPERQAYVISNGLKGVMLGLGAYILIDLASDLILRDLWDGEGLRRLAPLYASMDVVSLFRVPDMMNSTKIHHLMVGLLGLVVCVIDNGRGTIGGHICVYALFSTKAFFVNLFLG